MGVMLALDGKKFSSDELVARGVVIPNIKGFIDTNSSFSMKLAQDAQPAMFQSQNAGIPAWMTQYVDPEVIRVLFSPMKAAQIVGGEIKKGSFSTKTMQFGQVESIGQVSSYGDYSENGMSEANLNWIYRDSYNFQTFTQWGELELEVAGDAQIGLGSEKQIASAFVLAKALNKSYFYGVSGLRNYGLLNDPNLSAPLTPTAQWSLVGTTAQTVYDDIVRIVAKVITQTQGIVDADTPMVLAMSPTAALALNKTNQFNNNVKVLLNTNFKNMRFETAPEYSTGSGELVQLIVDSLDGKKVAEVAFNEKMRAHAVVVGSSSYKQKKSCGTWGAIIRYPIGIAQMLGV